MSLQPSTITLCPGGVLQSRQRALRFADDFVTFMSAADDLGPSGRSLPRLQPQLKRADPVSKLTTSGSKSLLGKLEARGRNRPGMLAAGIRIVEKEGADVVSAWGTVMKNGEGRIEVLFAADFQQHERLCGVGQCSWDELEFEVYPIHCPRPATVVATVSDHRGLEGELTSLLADAQCDVIQTFSSVGLPEPVPGGQLQHSFACLIARPPRLETSAIEWQLGPVAHARGGVAVVYEGCLKLGKDLQWLAP